MENDAETNNKKTSLQGMAIKVIAHNLNSYNQGIIRNFLPPPNRQMVIEYINEGGLAGTTNINSSAVLGLLNRDTKFIGRQLLTLIEPSQEMTSEEIAQLIDTLVQCITDANAPIQHLDLYYKYFGRLVTIMPSSFENICRMQSLSFLSVGDLQILLTQFVQITVDIATLNIIIAESVRINDDLGVLVRVCGRFVLQEFCYEGTIAREEFIHIEMKTEITGLVPQNALPMQMLRIIYLNDIAQLEMLGKLPNLTLLIVHVLWNFQVQELTDDRLPSWPKLKCIDITGRDRTISGQYLRRLLGKYGSQLEILILSRFGPTSNLTFRLLLDLCRNLLALEINCCHVSGSAPINSLHQLRSLIVHQSARYRPLEIAGFSFAPQLLYLTLNISNVATRDFYTLSIIILGLALYPNVRVLQSLRRLQVQQFPHDVNQHFDADSAAEALTRINRLHVILRTISGI